MNEIVIGVGVALAVLGNNNASLIGVAISASLLPPAVNCGMSMAFALIMSISLHKPDNFHSGDFVLLAGLSLALTLVNICAIFLSALGMFRLKEVVPVVNKVAFWKEDVKLYRGLNKQQKRLMTNRLTQRDRKTDELNRMVSRRDTAPGHRVMSSLTEPSFSGRTASTEDSSHIPQQDRGKWNKTNERKSGVSCSGSQDNLNTGLQRSDCLQ